MCGVIRKFCSNTKIKILMGVRENQFQISQNYILHMKFSEFYLCYHNSCEIWHSLIFSDSHEKFSLLLLQITYKNVKFKKKNAMFFNIFWYKVFVHWKLELLNFLVDSVLILLLKFECLKHGYRAKKKIGCMINE